MQKKIAITAVFLLSLGGAGWLFLQQAQAKQDGGRLHGNVDIRETNLAFRVGGRVAKVLVDEGSVVKAGDVLAELDSEPLRNSLQVAQASLAAISARNALLHKGYRAEDVKQAQARLQAAQAVLQEARKQVTRQQELSSAGSGPQKALDAALAQQAQAEAQVEVTRSQLQALQQGFRAEEVAESDALLAQAKANLQVAQLAVQDAVLRAPASGVILTRAIESGSMLSPGAPAFNLSLNTPVWARVYVSESQLGRFAPGSRVWLETDARPGKPYQGVVGFVSPTAEFTPKSVETADLRTSLVYRMRVVVQDPDSQLRQGMPVSVSLANNK